MSSSRWAAPRATAVVVVALLGLLASAAAAEASDRFSARHVVTPARGGAVRSHGWSLYVPGHVVRRTGVATIRRSRHGRVDIHISVPWRGPVRVAAPLRSRRDFVAHDISGVWLPEGSARGQRVVWVTQLSPFSLGSLLKGVQEGLCLSVFSGDWPGFAECLLEKAGAYVSGKIISWVASKVSSSCLAALVANGISAGSAKKVPTALLKGVLTSSACAGTASAPGPGGGSGSQPLPVTTNPQPGGGNPQGGAGSPQGPTGNPQQPAGAQPIFRVMNTSETLPDGVWFRNSPHIGDTDGVTGHGVYAGESVKLLCYGSGDAVGPYADSLWYEVLNVSRPTNAGVQNSGWLNAHYIDDGLRANEVDAGVVPC